MANWKALIIINGSPERSIGIVHVRLHLRHAFLKLLQDILKHTLHWKERYKKLPQFQIPNNLIAPKPQERRGKNTNTQNEMFRHKLILPSCPGQLCPRTHGFSPSSVEGNIIKYSSHHFTITYLILSTLYLPFITTLPSIWTAWKPMYISLFSGLLECDMWRGLVGWAPQKWFYGSIEQIDSHEQRTWPYSRDSNCLKAKVNILWFQIIHGRLQCEI